MPSALLGVMAWLDRKAIVRRIRRLLAGQDGGDVTVTAKRLGVDPSALRGSLDLESPRPSLTVMQALVREHGVDGMWLLYGTSDAGSPTVVADAPAKVTPDDALYLPDRPRTAGIDEGPRTVTVRDSREAMPRSPTK